MRKWDEFFLPSAAIRAIRGEPEFSGLMVIDNEKCMSLYIYSREVKELDVFFGNRRIFRKYFLGGARK
jgi:hypothetical protein